MPAAPPGPPRRKRGPGCVIGVLAGAFALVLLLAGGGFAIYLTSTSHDLATPPRAGGMTLDTRNDRSTDELTVTMRSVVQRATTPSEAHFVNGVYRDGDLAFLFVGFSGGYDRDDVISQLDFHLRNAFSTDDVRITTRIWEISDSGGDGMGLCGRVTAATGSTYSYSSICGWATRTTFALVVPASNYTRGNEPPEYKVSNLQRVMRAMRADVES